MKAIVIVLRGCSAGWLGAYGNEWVVTPHLDQLAAEGVVWDRHIVADPSTRFVPFALPHRILIRANHPDTDAPADYYAAWTEVFDARPQPSDDSPLQCVQRALPSLLDRLRDLPDWLVCLDTDCLLPPWDVSQEVFAAYLEDPESEEAHESDVEYDDDEPAPEAEPAEEPPTPWYDPPTGPLDDDAREWLHTTFAAVVSKCDAELGELFEMLRERGLAESAVWVVTADAGYPLGEHGYVGFHRPLLHTEVVHVPLLVRLPGALEAGRRVGVLTQPADVLLHIERLVRGEGVEGRTEAISRWGSDAAIRTAEWALVVPSDGGATLYEKPDDRWEVNDLSTRNVERVEELRTRLNGEP
jgi:hypothetical protein